MTTIAPHHAHFGAYHQMADSFAYHLKGKKAAAISIGPDSDVSAIELEVNGRRLGIDPASPLILPDGTGDLESLTLRPLFTRNPTDGLPGDLSLYIWPCVPPVFPRRGPRASAWKSTSINTSDVVIETVPTYGRSTARLYVVNDGSGSQDYRVDAGVVHDDNDTEWYPTWPTPGDATAYTSRSNSLNQLLLDVEGWELIRLVAKAGSADTVASRYVLED